MPKTDDATTFTLIFSKGLAERNRLPIDQVIKTLQEFQEMIREVGKQVQRRNGVESPDGDFGIELVASQSGITFHKGSLKANAAATRDISNAQETLHLILNNVRSYSKKKNVSRVEPEDAVMARRMYKIGELQSDSKNVLAVQVKVSDKRRQTATLDEQAIRNLETLNTPVMKIEGLTLFGKLRQLHDRSRDEDGGKYFWGELVIGSIETWRLRFNVGQLTQILPLFRHQVRVEGDATYFGNKSPRLDVRAISEDYERNTLDAFASMREAGAAIFEDADPEELLAELYS